MAERVEQEPAERDVVALWDVEAKLFCDLVDRAGAVNQEASLVDANDRRAGLAVVLVVEIADELRDEAVDRENACETAVLVDDDGKASPAPPHLGEDFEGRTCLWHHIRLAKA